MVPPSGYLAMFSAIGVGTFMVLLGVAGLFVVIYYSKSVYHTFAWIMTYIGIAWLAMTLRIIIYLIRIGHFHQYEYAMRPIQRDTDIIVRENTFYAVFIMHSINMLHYKAVQSISSFSALRGSTHGITLTYCLAIYGMIGFCGSIIVMHQDDVTTNQIIAAALILSACVGAMWVGFLEVDNDTGLVIFCALFYLIYCFTIRNVFKYAYW